MCGDVNAFFSEIDVGDGEEPVMLQAAELEIMIAEPTRRRGGLARAAWATIEAHTRFLGRKSVNFEIGMCAPQKCAARLRCCPGNGGMGGRGHLQQEFSMQTMIWGCSDRLF